MVTNWVWIAWFGGVGGAVVAWLTHQREPLPTVRHLGPAGGRVVAPGQLGHVSIAAATSALIGWLTGAELAGSRLVDQPLSAALAFMGIGFVTASWVAAERDKRVLRQAVCQAAVAPAAHPETLGDLAHASPDTVYAMVQALVPPPATRT